MNAAAAAVAIVVIVVVCMQFKKWSQQCHPLVHSRKHKIRRTNAYIAFETEWHGCRVREKKHSKSKLKWLVAGEVTWIERNTQVIYFTHFCSSHLFCPICAHLLSFVYRLRWAYSVPQRATRERSRIQKNGEI